MRVPLRHREADYMEVSPTGIPDFMQEIKTYDYGHQNPLLAEIAGHIFNRYLQFRKTTDRYGEHYEFRFGGTNPHKAILQLHMHLSEENPSKELHTAFYENAIEEILHKCFDAIEFKHATQKGDRLPAPH